MENASKALVMAGSLLIGMIIFAIFVTTMNKTSEAQFQLETSIAIEQVQAFNAHYTAYADKEKIGPDDVATMYSFTVDWLASNPSDTFSFTVVGSNTLSLNGEPDKQIAKFLDGNTTAYKMQNITYDEKTGRVTGLRLVPA